MPWLLNELLAMNYRSGSYQAKEAPDTCCELIAAEQHGVVSRAQALATGMTPREIQHRLSSGKWQSALPGTYVPLAVPRSWHQDLAAACLWAGEASAISHRAAAALWELDPFRPGLVELTTSRWIRSSDIVIHHSRRFPRCDVSTRNGIVVTSPTRTLIDLGAVSSDEDVEIAMDCALRRGLTSIPYIRRRLARIGGRGARGAGVLRRLLDSRDPACAPTESVLESRFRALVRRAGLQPPITQQVIQSEQGLVARVDFAYTDIRLLIEVDGWDHHANKEIWQHDLHRNNTLTNLGWKVLRFSWADVTRRGETVIAQLVDALGGSPQLSFGQ